MNPQQPGVSAGRQPDRSPTTPQDDQNQSLPWTRADWIAVLLLGLGVVLAMARFWRPGIAGEADMLMGIYRVFELDHAWRQGVFYPRLGAALNFTYTAPLFQFYPPLASFGAILWKWAGLGWIESSKAVFTGSLALAGWGAYIYARWLFRDRRAAFVTAAAYLFAPYLLTNIYERGAAAEALALGLLPWVFWSLHRALDKPTRSRVAAGGVVVGWLILAHNITALFVLPAVLGYLLLVAWRERRLRQLAAVGAAIALGFGLSAFYWMPAMGEIGTTQVEASMLSGPLSAANNLAPLHDLVQRSLAVDYWGSQRFHLALWQACVLLVSMIAIPFQTARTRFILILYTGLAVIALVLQLTLARAFWETVPLVRFIQFPWRLLGLISFCTAMLAGSVFLLRPLRGAAGTVLAASLLLSIGVAGLLRLTPDLSPIWSTLRNEQINEQDLFERGRAGFALFSDYAPKDLQASSSSLSLPRSPDLPRSAPLPAGLQVQVISEESTHVHIRTQSDAPAPIRLHRIYFPGWRATVDGRRVPVNPSGPLGLVTAEIPAGVHDVEFHFGNTPLRWIGLAISLASLVVLAWIVLRSRHRTAILLGVGGALAVLALLFWLHPGRGEPDRQPVPAIADFEDQLSLLAYDLPSTEWKAGSTVPIKLYWLARQAPSADYAVFLHLAQLDDSGKVAQSDSQPIYGYSPTTQWEPGEIVADRQALELDEAIPPGRYRLLMGVYRPDVMQNLAVRGTDDVLPGDRLVLAEIEVTDD